MPNFRLAAHYINMCTNVPLTLVKSIGKCRKFAQSLWSAKIEYQLDLHRNFDRIFFNFQPVVTGISLSNHLNPKIKTSSMPILNCFPYFHVFLSHSFLLYFCFIRSWILLTKCNLIRQFKSLVPIYDTREKCWPDRYLNLWPSDDLIFEKCGYLG